MQNWIEALKLHSAGHTMVAGQPRHGLVTGVDAANHCVKVTLEPDGVETGWIPDAAIAASGLRIACPSEVGTQVIVVPVEGDSEHPVLIGRVFDTVMTTPVSPVTSRPVAPGEIGIFLAGGVYLHITNAGTHIGGDLIVAGRIKATQDIQTGPVSLQHHTHTQVQSGSGVSGPPVR